MPKIVLRSFRCGRRGVRDGADDIVGQMGLPLSRLEIIKLGEAAVEKDWSVLQGSLSHRQAIPIVTDLSGLSVLGVDDTAVNREVLL